MDPKNFIAPEWGRAVSTGGSASYHAFVPMPVPRELALSPKTIMFLSEADASILREVGEGAGRRHRWFADDILRVLDPQF